MARFVYDLQMRWGDMDAFQHVNNVVYLRYLEQARVAMFFDAAKGTPSFEDAVVIARHEIEYLAPVVYHPEPLRFELWIEDVGGAAFTVRYEVFDNGRLAARAMSVVVGYDFNTGGARRLTESERAILAGYADEQAA